MATSLDRRSFLQNTLKVAGSAAVVAPSLVGLAACNDMPAPAEPGAVDLSRARRGNFAYGSLQQDPGGLPFLIPAGFTLREISRAGNPLAGGRPGVVPNAFDGMGAYADGPGRVRLVRNHEIRDTARANSAFGANPYDSAAGAGCTTLVVDIDPATTEPTVVDEFVSISGTFVNCAGGLTPWGTWITCEETTAGTNNGFGKNHGYNFEVPAMANAEVAEAVPLTAMGRFSHEAIAVDPRTGVVYETEDAGATTSGFYRFIPNVVGQLAQGGRLQMLEVVGRPQLNTGAGGIPPLTPLPARWVDIDNPDPNLAGGQASCFNQGLARGGARFARLEGAWWADDSVFINSTSGGAVGAGQVWQYRPLSADEGQLILIFESPSASVLDAPDNICVSPRGGLVLCEDGGGTQFIRGLTRQGQIFDFARSADPVDATEFCGACFSPDGRILFFNTQGSTASNGTERGGTFAIWGPWGQGAL